MILWSDDCLSCLCGFPHSYEKHMQAVLAAMSEQRQQIADMEHDMRDVLEEETDDNQGDLE